MKSRIICHLLVIVLFLLGGCGANKGKVQKSKKTPSKVASIASTKAINDDAVRQFLTEYLGIDFDFEINETTLQIVLKGNLALSDDDFSQKISLLSLKAPEKLPGINQIIIEGTSVDKTIKKVSFLMSDSKQFLKGEISKPEFDRRQQVEQIETPESLRLKINFARTQNQGVVALDLLDKLIKLEPNNNKLKAARGNLLRDLGRCSEALDVYSQLSVAVGFEFFSFWNMAFCQDVLNQPDASIASYEKALSIDPNQPQLMIQLSEVYLKKGDTTKAQEWLDKSEVFEKTDMSLWIRALIFREQKKIKEAQALLAQIHADGSIAHKILYNQVVLDLDNKDLLSAKKKLADLNLKAPNLAYELNQLECLNQ